MVNIPHPGAWRRPSDFLGLVADQVSQGRRACLLTTLPDRDAVRLSHQEGTLFSGWQVARPSASLGLDFDSCTFQALLKWHLGIPLIPQDRAGGLCPLGCCSPIDALGDHMVTCLKAKSWQRHQCIQSFMARFRQASIPHRLEVSVLGDQKRDADILLPNWDSAQ